MKKLKYWLQNLSRFVVCISAIYLAIELSKSLDKFLSILGAVLCAPLAILYPALLHLAALAKTRSDKIKDILLVVLAVSVMIFSTGQVLAS